MFYRKIGGLHWLFIGRVRLVFCVVRRRTTFAMPIDLNNFTLRRWRYPYVVYSQERP